MSKLGPPSEGTLTKVMTLRGQGRNRMSCGRDHVGQSGVHLNLPCSNLGSPHYRRRHQALSFPFFNFPFHSLPSNSQLTLTSQPFLIRS